MLLFSLCACPRGSRCCLGSRRLTRTAWGSATEATLSTKPLYSCGFFRTPSFDTMRLSSGKVNEKSLFSTIFLGICAYFADICPYFFDFYPASGQFRTNRRCGAYFMESIAHALFQAEKHFPARREGCGDRRVQRIDD